MWLNTFCILYFGLQNIWLPYFSCFFITWKIHIPLIGFGPMCRGRGALGILVSELLLRLLKPLFSERWLFFQLRAQCVTNIPIFSRQHQKQSEKKAFLIRRHLKTKGGASRKHQNTKQSLETCIHRISEAPRAVLLSHPIGQETKRSTKKSYRSNHTYD